MSPPHSVACRTLRYTQALQLAWNKKYTTYLSLWQMAVITGYYSILARHINTVDLLRECTEKIGECSGCRGGSEGSNKSPTSSVDKHKLCGLYADLEHHMYSPLSYCGQKLQMSHQTLQLRSSTCRHSSEIHEKRSVTAHMCVKSTCWMDLG